jgi:uncharacterized protein YdeI (YjbR/CyaY-like superfamily)
VGTDDGLPRIRFASPAEWEAWLEDNHAVSQGVWIKMAKKDSPIESVRYPEVLEIALCFGWIDGRREALDERCFLQRYTPRRPRSKWSRINREKAERLIADGRVHQAGLAEVERAKADGRCEAAYEGQKSSTVPSDLQRELDARPKAKAFFAELNSQNRYAILYRLRDAKKPETRTATGEIRRDARGGRDDPPVANSSDNAAAARVLLLDHAPRSGVPSSPLLATGFA